MHHLLLHSLLHIETVQAHSPGTIMQLGHILKSQQPYPRCLIISEWNFSYRKLSELKGRTEAYLSRTHPKLPLKPCLWRKMSMCNQVDVTDPINGRCSDVTPNQTN